MRSVRIELKNLLGQPCALFAAISDVAQCAYFIQHVCAVAKHARASNVIWKGHHNLTFLGQVDIASPPATCTTEEVTDEL